jgi:hypothetical protein
MPENQETQDQMPDQGDNAPQRQKPSVKSGSKKRPATANTTSGDAHGLTIGTLLFGILERTMPQFHPVVRSFIGVVLVLLLAVYVLNGVAMPTYIQGQVYVDNAPAAGIEAAYSGATPMDSNSLGYWMLPITHGNLPLKIHLDFNYAAGVAARLGANKDYIGSAEVRGPWPLWSAFVPMQYVFRIGTKNSGSGEIRVEHIASRQDYSLVSTAYAQPSFDTLRAGLRAALLSIDAVRAEDIPGFFRRSGRIFFRFYMDGQRVPDQQLTADGMPFPLESQKQAWLPVREKTTEPFAGYSADIGSLLQEPTGPVNAPFLNPKGNIMIEAVADDGTSLGSTSLNPLFESRPYKAKLSAGKAFTLTVSIVPSGLPIIAPDAKSVAFLTSELRKYGLTLIDPPELGLSSGSLAVERDKRVAFLGLPLGVAMPQATSLTMAMQSNGTGGASVFLRDLGIGGSSSFAFNEQISVSGQRVSTDNITTILENAFVQQRIKAFLADKRNKVFLVSEVFTTGEILAHHPATDQGPRLSSFLPACAESHPQSGGGGTMICSADGNTVRLSAGVPVAFAAKLLPIKLKADGRLDVEVVGKN